MTATTPTNISRFLVSVCALLLAGCAANPEASVTIAAPKTPIAKNLTSFRQAKSCMDRLFAQYGKRGIVITSDDIPDQTGTINAGTRDMLISILSELSATSEAFRYVDIQTRQNAIFVVQNAIEKQGGGGFDLPPHYIRGAITAVDQNVTSDSTSGGFSIPVFGTGVSADQVTSIVTIDLQLGKTDTRQILPGSAVTNTITVVSTGIGASAEGLINEGALSVDISRNRTEGTGQAVRTLLEYSLIELLGKFTKVPYSRCLELPSTQAARLSDLRSSYDALSEEARLRTVQGAMRGADAYSGPIDGTYSNGFRDALNLFKRQRNLIANGRVDFDLYAVLADEALLIPGAPAPERAPDQTLGSASGITPTVGRDPIGLKLVPPAQALSVGDIFAFDVSVQRDADLYCYYEYVVNGRREVARIYPNDFSPTPRLAGGTRISLPHPDAPFQLRLAERGKKESVVCVATTADYDVRSPYPLKTEALQPIKIGKRTVGIADVVDAHSAIDSDRTSIQVVGFSAQ